MKLAILEEISFSHISFFTEEINCSLLESLLNSIIQNVKVPGIYDYFIKYLDVLFIHCIKQTFSMLNFIKFLLFLFQKIEVDKIFFLTIKYCKKFFLHLQEENKLFSITPGSLLSQEVIGFLMILAKSSCGLTNVTYERQMLQEMLNIYSIFIIIKTFNFNSLDFTSKFKLIKDDVISDFATYFMIFAENLPILIFNRNTSLINPIKIDLNYLVLNTLNERKKTIIDEFEDLGENTRKWIRELDVIPQLYLLGIYYAIVSRFVILKIYFSLDIDQKDIFKSKIGIEMVLNEKASIVNLLGYLSDNLFLYDKEMNDIFSKIFDRYVLKYLDLLKNYHNTRFKQRLLSNDLMNLLNYSCFYHELVRNKAIFIINMYAESFPFLLNEYDIFEYYVTVLGMLISHTLRPFEFFIKRINIENKYTLELPSEHLAKETIYNKLCAIFERCLQKSHIINNNNIVYNISNYVNKCTLLVLSFDREEANYAINILNKIYNNIKKVEVSSFLKTTAYLDPRKFEDYLKENVYKNFDKYLTLSALDDIYNYTDSAKSTILQIRNKYLGIIEGKINNLRVNYANDLLYTKFKKLYSSSQDEATINSYTYYKIINDLNIKIQEIFKDDDLKNINQNIFPILVELTSFIVFAGNAEFSTIFNKEIITDEIINLITSIPIFLASSSSIEAGSICWEWILYYNKDKLPSLLNNIILSIKSLKQYTNLKKTSFFDPNLSK